MGVNVLTIEEQLKMLILERYGNIVAFSKAVDIPNTTITSILKRGVLNASIDSVIRICKELGISADELANNRITPAPDAQTDAPQDFETVINHIRHNIGESRNFTIDGKPITNDEFSIIITALEVAVGIIKRDRGIR